MGSKTLTPEAPLAGFELVISKLAGVGGKASFFGRKNKKVIKPTAANTITTTVTFIFLGMFFIIF
jgi:hypothetical protein